MLGCKIVFSSGSPIRTIHSGPVPRKQSGGGERLYNQADNARNAHAKHPVDKVYSTIHLARQYRP